MSYYRQIEEGVRSVPTYAASITTGDQSARWATSRSNNTLGYIRIHEYLSRQIIFFFNLHQKFRWYEKG